MELPDQNLPPKPAFQISPNNNLLFVRHFRQKWILFQAIPESSENLLMNIKEFQAAQELFGFQKLYSDLLLLEAAPGHRTGGSCCKSFPFTDPSRTLCCN